MNGVDPLGPLLDQVQPPQPSEGFVNRVTAAAQAVPQERTLPARAEGRDRRGPWARRHRTLATFIAANLLVASAVAAALVSGQGIEPLRKVPLIAPVIEHISPRHRPMVASAAHRAPTHTHPVAAEPVQPEPAAAAAPDVQTPRPAMLVDQQQQLSRRRVALAGLVARREAAGLPVPPRLMRRAALQSLQQQAMDRRAAGEPVPPALRRQIARERLALAPPVVRQRIRAEIRARRAAGERVPPLPELMREQVPPEPTQAYAGSEEPRAFPSFEEWAAERRERRRAYLRSLSPEERWQMRQQERDRADAEPPPLPPEER